MMDFFKNTFIISMAIVMAVMVTTVYQQINIKQGIIDGSASKPALRQDTGYMVEKT